jgi:hypothetical protein
MRVPGREAAVIAKVAFTSQDRVREAIRHFSADGSGWRCPALGDDPLTCGSCLRRRAGHGPAIRPGSLTATAGPGRPAAGGMSLMAWLPVAHRYCTA